VQWAIWGLEASMGDWTQVPLSGSQNIVAVGFSHPLL
jgi:hypothetical protein